MGRGADSGAESVAWGTGVTPSCPRVAVRWSWPTGSAHRPAAPV